jgi:putative transposase
MDPATRPPNGAALRRGRHSVIGQEYLITTVASGRRPIFADFDLSRRVINELRRCDSYGRCDTLAFVLMPDHLHWLLKLKRGDLARLLQLFKARSAKIVNRHNGTPGQAVWQRGFFDHALRREEDTRAAARYIIANPLRAGISRRVGDYPHWDVVWL